MVCCCPLRPFYLRLHYDFYVGNLNDNLKQFIKDYILRLHYSIFDSYTGNVITMEEFPISLQLVPNKKFKFLPYYPNDPTPPYDVMMSIAESYLAGNIYFPDELKKPIISNNFDNFFSLYYTPPSFWAQYNYNRRVSKFSDFNFVSVSPYICKDEFLIYNDLEFYTTHNFTDPASGLFFNVHVITTFSFDCTVLDSDILKSSWSDEFVSSLNSYASRVQHV